MHIEVGAAMRSTCGGMPWARHRSPTRPTNNCSVSITPTQPGRRHRRSREPSAPVGVSAQMHRKIDTGATVGTIKRALKLPGQQWQRAHIDERLACRVGMNCHHALRAGVLGEQQVESLLVPDLVRQGRARPRPQPSGAIAFALAERPDELLTSGQRTRGRRTQLAGFRPQALTLGTQRDPLAAAPRGSTESAFQSCFAADTSTQTIPLLPSWSAITVSEGALLPSTTVPPAATAAAIRCSATSGAT